MCGDVGSQIINPSGAEAQVQGAVIDGLSELMSQEITLEARPRGSDQLQPAPLASPEPAPQIEVHFLKSGQSADRSRRTGACRP